VVFPLEATPKSSLSVAGYTTPADPDHPGMDTSAETRGCATCRSPFGVIRGTWLRWMRSSS